MLPLKGFGIEQAEELSEDRTERYQLQLGFPSHGFKVSLVWVGHRLARAPRKSWSARLPVRLSVRPRLARVCALGGGPPGVCAPGWAGYVGKRKGDIWGMRVSVQAWTGACVGRSQMVLLGFV